MRKFFSARRDGTFVGAAALLAALAVLAGCAKGAGSGGPRVIAVETFLADIAGAVAGDRLAVRSLLPVGVDPHAYEPVPRDASMVADSDLVLANGAGVESFLGTLLESAGRGGGRRPRVVEASAGLVPRTPRPGELAVPPGDGGAGEVDPHFWLDPLSVVRYVENIRAALADLDAAGAAVYEANAAAYAAKLLELDRWIASEVSRIPEAERMLVTNHESLGYFADRYGFRVVGSIIPSVSTGAAPSARGFAALAARLKATGAKAVFLETGSDPRLARQLAAETGVRVVEGLYTHSVTPPDGPAPTYLEMMRANARAIVGALAPNAGGLP